MTSKLFLPIIAIVSVFTFWDFPSVFFQQDEWHGLGFMLSEGSRYLGMDQTPFQLFFSGDRFFARIINYFIFMTFGLDTKPFVFAALFFHFINAFLVYKLTYILTKKKIFGYIAVLFFLTNGISNQAYTWFGTVAGSAPSLTFVLLSVYFYFKFIFRGKNSFKYLSLFFIWLSFLFKEVGLFLFVLYPVIFFLFKNKKLKENIRENLPFIFYGIFMVVIRAGDIIRPVGPAINLVTTRTNFSEVLLNVILYPLDGISQIFIPNLLYPISGLFVSLIFREIQPFTTEFDVASQQTFGPFITIMASLVLLLVFYKISKKIKKEYLKPFWFSLLFIVLSFIPYIVIKKSEVFLEQRYYYPASVGAAILLSIVFAPVWKAKKKIVRFGGILLAVLILFNNILMIREDLRFQKEMGEERVKFLTTVQDEVPKLPSKIIFYFNSDSPGYYGLPEVRVPFQSGLGQILLSVYSMKGQINPVFFREDSLSEMKNEGFLYNILGQGYKEIDGRGFGYFFDREKLIKTIKFYKLEPKYVYAFYYRSEKMKLENVSLSIRKELNAL